MKKVLIVFGTRPEAIKCFPVVEALRALSNVIVEICVTAQHRQMLDQVMDLAGISADIDLNLMKPDQTLAALTAAAISQLSDVVARRRPDWVLVQGDTATAMTAALAAFYNRVPVGHIEAGLRSGNIYSPWPEEVNRRVVSTIAALHFAPTEGARHNLLRENTPASDILVTGNTVIDALLHTRRRLADGGGLSKYLAGLPAIDPARKLILVTSHRREHFDGGLRSIFLALRRLAGRADVQIVFPVHPNPRVQEAAQEILSNVPNVVLIPPQDYIPFVWLMTQSELILTDSGGVQEEAPSLGKPVLVMRDTTERPEGVAGGTACLVGSATDAIVSAAEELLDGRSSWFRMGRVNPYGDGNAAVRIAKAIADA